MKIYTKTGDAGETGLFGGARVSKADLRVQAYGAVDELNSVVGVARAELARGELPDGELALGPLLERIQMELFDVGAELATVPEKLGELSLPQVSGEAIAQLEAAIDQGEQELAPLQSFILPGGSASAAQLHLARTVCRRAERLLVALSAASTVRTEPTIYLNRLSDLFFVLARVANVRAGVADVEWKGRDRA